MSNDEELSRPVLFLITGAWHGSWMFDSVVEPLAAAGYSTSVIQLPSTGVQDGPPLEKSHDVQHIRREISQEIDNGREIAIICHSYAGVPACDAVKGLSIPERQEKEQEGGVRCLIFVAAFVLRHGCTVLDLNAKYQHAEFLHDKGMIVPAQPEALFYNDLPHDLASRLSQLLKPHSAITFVSPLEYEAYRNIPSTYLVCTNDRAVALEAQEEMLSHSLQFFDLVERVDAGHLPFISCPQQTVRFIHKSLELLKSKSQTILCDNSTAK
ncbi:hypothetical protein O181_050651 [Austropuccinia psidii MF-1]|uniref:AB hydrolase-1 domain-containing protein n=1 Tax=Austropuccinia psidii MF-1 TaxID=1389203 RepID=A0A9Q3E275_9BASI|nr:hypothetical protein [Austropuccinia psidii MF-1]